MPVTPKHFSKGKPLKASDLNDNTKGIQQAQKVSGDLEARMVGKTKVISQTEQPNVQGGTQIRKAQITALQEDYYECVFYNEQSATTGAVVNVAKPLAHRASYYDGETFTYADGDSIDYTKDSTNPEWKRQADPGAGNQDQELIPNPRVGEIIPVFKTNTSVQVSNVYLFWEEMPGVRHWGEV